MISSFVWLWGERAECFLFLFWLLVELFNDSDVHSQ